MDLRFGSRVRLYSYRPMKFRPLLTALFLGLALLSRVTAQEAAPAAPSAADAAILDELKAIVTAVSAKMRAGPVTAEDLAVDIAKFDELLAKHPEKTDTTAQVAMMKAMLYLQVLKDESKGRELLLAVKTDFPGTQAA